MLEVLDPSLGTGHRRAYAAHPRSGRRAIAKPGPTRGYDPRMSAFRVVVAGGGIAAVEGLLRLRRLLGSSVDIDFVAPNDELVMRPLAVRQPFAFGPPSRYELGRIPATTLPRALPPSQGHTNAAAFPCEAGVGAVAEDVERAR
jgi:hypothetical protein